MTKEAKDAKTKGAKGAQAETAEPAWCLICSAKPAVGRLRRVFQRERVPVPVDAVANPEAVPVQVCNACGKRHDAQITKSIDGRRVVWEFALG